MMFRIFFSLLLLTVPLLSQAAETQTDKSKLANSAKLVLSKYCGECHTATGDGGIDYITDLAKLVELDKVVPGKGDQSRLLQRMMEATQSQIDLDLRIDSRFLAPRKVDSDQNPFRLPSRCCSDGKLQGHSSPDIKQLGLDKVNRRRGAFELLNFGESTTGALSEEMKQSRSFMRRR